MNRNPKEKGGYRGMIDPGYEELYAMYHKEQLSLGEIGVRLGCTRQYVHKLMVEYGVKRRSKKVASRVGREHGRWPGRVPAEPRASDPGYIS